MTQKPLTNNKPTIAVLTNLMSTPFAEGIIFGATDYGNQHNYNVLSYVGGSLGKPNQIDEARDRLFNLIDHDAINGVILPIGALSRFLPFEDQMAFLNQFSHVPVVTINSDIPGYMNVGYSPRQGMFELVQHLVERHQVKRFIYAGATGNHRSSIRKKQQFTAALAAHGITFDERLHLTTDTQVDATIVGLEQLFAVNQEQRPQAIVAGTDTQAISILAALKKLGIRVPEDIIVTGSTGHKDSLFAEPPLSTILEPTYEMGWHGAERLVAAIEKRPYKESLDLPTSLIVRRSCGCNRPGEQSALQEQADKHTRQSNALQLDTVQAKLENIFSSAPPIQQVSIAANTPFELAQRLMQDVEQNQSQALIAYLHRGLELSIKSEALFLWSKLALGIHELLIQHLGNAATSANERHIATELFKIVQDCSEKAGHYRDFKTDTYANILREIGIELNSDLNPTKIAQLLTQRLKIKDCYINIFEESNKPGGSVRNFLAIRDGILLDSDEEPFDPKILIPPKTPTYSDTFAIQVLPLTFKGEFLGLFALSVSERKGVIYESLLTLFSSALKNQIHMRKLREAEKKFSDIAHSASDWLWEIDTEANFTYCSEGVEQVLGYKPSHLLNRPISDFLADPDPAYASELIQSMNSEKGLVAHEAVYRHKNGEERVLLTTGKAISKHGAVVGYRGAYRDISKVKQQEERIMVLAYRDSLSNLPNRTLFNDRLSQVLASSQRTHQKFAVLFIDLDGFKYVNDSMGHDAGDILLSEVAKLFTLCVREEDTLARFGGDEFAIVLPRIESHQDAVRVAERMQKVLTIPILIHGQPIFISASIGIAIYPADGQTAEALLKKADKAMYNSKMSGKSRFSFYAPEQEQTTNRSMVIRNLLHEALRDDGFRLLYQPLMYEETGQISGAEALIRFSGPEALTIGPADFIPLAEEVGLIDQIGQWVFKAACEQQRQWTEAGYHLKCSINVSAKQFRNTNLANEFIETLKSTGAEPAMITLEITENAVIDNEEAAQKTLKQLSDYGLRIAIDDFGTGYASLSYLRKIPADIIKIDRAFVCDCEANASIISAIIMMATGLKLKVVAEGVETESQKKFLSALGCDELQGYLIAKPMSSASFLDFVDARDPTSQC